MFVVVCCWRAWLSCVLRAVRCVSFVVCCLLVFVFVCCCLMFVVRCGRLLVVRRCLVFVLCRLLFAGCLLYV